MPQVPVNYEPDEPTLRPAQSVLPVPYAPKLPQAALLPFEELAGLSGTLAKISLQQKEQANKAELEIGRKAGLDAGDDVIDQLAQAHKNLSDVEYQKKLNQAAYLQAEKEGKIPPSANEWRGVGFTESVSRRIMGKYESELIAAQTQATAVMDKNGNPVPAKPVEQVISEVWDKYKDNPFFTDYYGKKTANDAKQAIDARFRQDVATKLSSNQAEEYQTNTANEITRWATTKNMKDGIEPSDFENLDSVMNTHRLQGVDLRKAYRQGLLAAAINANATDRGDGNESAGAALLRKMKLIPIGSTTLGDDAEMGAWLDTQIGKMNDEALDKKAKKIAGIKDDETILNKTAEKDMNTAVDAARKANGDHGIENTSDAAEMDRFITDGEGSHRWGADTPGVVRYLRELQRSTYNQDSAATRERFLGALDTSKDPGSVQQMLDRETTQGTISYQDRKAVQAEIDNYGKVADLTEDPSSKRADSLILEASNIEGVVPGSLHGLTTQTRDILDQFQKDRSRYARTLSGKPETERRDLLESWNDEHGKVLVTQVRENAKKAVDLRVDTQSKIRDALGKGEDIPPELLSIDKNLAPDEIDRYRRQQDEQQKARENFLSSPAYDRFVLARKQEAIAAAEKDGLEPKDQYGLASVVEAEVRAKAKGLLAAAQAEAKSPGEVPTLFQDKMVDYGVEWGKTYAGANVSRWQSFFRPKVEPAAGAEQQTIGEQTKVSKSNEDNFQASQTLSAIPESDKASYAKSMIAQQDPNVPKGAYDVIKGALSGARTGLWGIFSTHTIADAEGRVFDESLGMLGRTDLSDDAKARAIVNMNSMLGVPFDDMLKGQVTVTLPDAYRKSLEKILSDHESVGLPDVFERTVTNSRDMTFQQYVSQRKELVKGYLDAPPKVVKIPTGLDANNKSAINIYTTKMFPDNASLEAAFKNRRDDVKALLVQYGGTDTDEDIRKLHDAQIDLNDRRANLGR